MDKEEMEYLTRSQENTRTNRRKEYKMNRTLNYLIALVSVLLVITLGIIFMTGDEDEAEQQPQTEDSAVQSEGSAAEEEDKQEDETEVGQPATNDATNEESDEDNSKVDTSDEAVINASDDPLVAEVWTSEAWQAYPTAQTGEHQSTFVEGHIDYEEKLQSIFSVVPIEQQESIIWSVKNNGNAKSAIAVISSNDKTQKYRVAIEWVDEQGWKPVQVEVLNTLEGTY
ncbi:MAG: DUF1510 family protein [Lysinibacillus sp.]